MLYADHLNDPPKSADAFHRHLELGGAHAQAKAPVTRADQAARSPLPSPSLPL